MGRGGLLSGHDELPRMIMFYLLPPKVVRAEVVECSTDAYSSCVPVLSL